MLPSVFGWPPISFCDMLVGIFFYSIAFLCGDKFKISSLQLHSMTTTRRRDQLKRLERLEANPRRFVDVLSAQGLWTPDHSPVGGAEGGDWLIDLLIFPVSVMHNKMLAPLLRKHMDCKGKRWSTQVVQPIPTPGADDAEPVLLIPIGGHAFLASKESLPSFRPSCLSFRQSLWYKLNDLDWFYYTRELSLNLELI